METATAKVPASQGSDAAANVRSTVAAGKDAQQLVACHYCEKPDLPIFLGGEGAHICGDCWLESHKDDPPDNPMPWEVGS